MPLPPISSDPDRFRGEPESSWLDQEHIIEPLDGADPTASPSDPLVVDVTGRMWRLRYRPAWTRLLARAAPVLVGVVLLALLLVMRI